MIPNPSNRGLTDHHAFDGEAVTNLEEKRGNAELSSNTSLPTISTKFIIKCLVNLVLLQYSTGYYWVAELQAPSNTLCLISPYHRLYVLPDDQG